MKRFKILAVIAIIALAGCLVLGCSSDSGSGGGDAGGGGGGSTVGFGGGKGGGGGSVGPGPDGGGPTEAQLKTAMNDLLKNVLGLTDSEIAEMDLAGIMAAINAGLDDIDLESIDDWAAKLGPLVNAGLMDREIELESEGDFENLSNRDQLTWIFQQIVNDVFGAADALIDDELGSEVEYVFSETPTISALINHEYGPNWIALDENGHTVTSLAGDAIEEVTLCYIIGSGNTAWISTGHDVELIPVARFEVAWGDSGDPPYTGVTITINYWDGTDNATADLDFEAGETSTCLIPISAVTIAIYNEDNDPVVFAGTATVVLVITDGTSTIATSALKQGDTPVPGAIASGPVSTWPGDYTIAVQSKVYTIVLTHTP